MNLVLLHSATGKQAMQTLIIRSLTLMMMKTSLWSSRLLQDLKYSLLSVARPSRRPLQST